MDLQQLDPQLLIERANLGSRLMFQVDEALSKLGIPQNDMPYISRPRFSQFAVHHPLRDASDLAAAPAAVAYEFVKLAVRTMWTARATCNQWQYREHYGDIVVYVMASVYPGAPPP
jgi:hypothetical protein